MKEIKLRFEPADLERLDQQAQEQGISRAELIRDRVLSGEAKSPLSTLQFNQLLADAQRYMQGHVDRRQIETLVSYVFNRLCHG
jgi:hypothetical protein